MSQGGHHGDSWLTNPVKSVFDPGVEDFGEESESGLHLRVRQKSNGISFFVKEI